MHIQQNIKKKICSSLQVFIAACCLWTSATTQAQTDVQSKIDNLKQLVQEANGQNIDTKREHMTLTTAALFLNWIEWDKQNISKNAEFYKEHKLYKTQAVAHATALPEYELESVAHILDESIAELTAVINGEIQRKSVPDIDFEKVKTEDGQFNIEGRSVYLNTYTWKPNLGEADAYFGNLNSAFIAPNYVTDPSGQFNTRRADKIAQEVDNRIGQVFISHSNIPDWAYNTYDNFAEGSRLFSKYDIDNPGAETLFDALLKAYVPILKGTRSAELGYMVFNEPSFFTAEGSWNNGGVSEFTHNKFRQWLATKHKTIENLNAIWLTQYSTFEEISLTIPLSNQLKSTPIWFDWMRFNQARVTQWFVFLDKTIKKYDSNAKTHIKLMPWLWNKNQRDHGLDFEALLNIGDIIGFDANSEYSNLRAEQPYQQYYSFDWQSPVISFDFFKSIQPDQILWDSENHFFTKGSFQEKDIDPNYVNSIYWLAATQGLSGSSTWVWGRNADGSIIEQRGINSEYIVDVTHQPIGLHALTRSLMEINAHHDDVVKLQKINKPIRIFYSETSAIIGDDYMTDIRAAHERLAFQGVGLGFATEKLISTKKMNEPIVVIYKTPFVSQKERVAINAYIQQGGNVFIDNQSLKFDEYKRAHLELNASGLGSVTSFVHLDDLHNKVIAKTKALSLEPLITIDESVNRRTVLWRTAVKSDGAHVVSLINVGKQNSSVSISHKKEDKQLQAIDLLTGKTVDTQITLKPLEHRFLEVQAFDKLIPDKEPDSTDTTEVKTPAVEIEEGGGTFTVFFYFVVLLVHIFRYTRFNYIFRLKR